MNCPGPDRCVDDLCRGQDQGLCGKWSAHSMGIHDDCFGCGAEDDWSDDEEPWT